MKLIKAWVKAFDQGAIQSIARRRAPWLTQLMSATTHMGDKIAMVIIGLLLGFFLSWRIGFALGFGAGGGGIAAQIFKRLIGRVRPTVGIEGFESIAGNPDKFSFPSGHTATAFGAAFALFGQIGGFSYGAIALAPLIGFSRIYLGAHYPSDVVAGAFLGTCVGITVNLLMF